MALTACRYAFGIAALTTTILALGLAQQARGGSAHEMWLLALHTSRLLDGYAAIYAAAGPIALNARAGVCFHRGERSLAEELYIAAHVSHSHSTAQHSTAQPAGSLLVRTARPPHQRSVPVAPHARTAPAQTLLCPLEAQTLCWADICMAHS